MEGEEMKLKKLLHKIYHDTAVDITFYDSEKPEYRGKLGKMPIEQFINIANRKVYSISVSSAGVTYITILDNDGINV